MLREGALTKLLSVLHCHSTSSETGYFVHTVCCPSVNWEAEAAMAVPTPQMKTQGLLRWLLQFTVTEVDGSEMSQRWMYGPQRHSCQSVRGTAQPWGVQQSRTWHLPSASTQLREGEGWSDAALTVLSIINPEGPRLLLAHHHSLPPGLPPKPVMQS